jgi:hypothetical protein
VPVVSSSSHHSKSSQLQIQTPLCFPSQFLPPDRVSTP